MLREVLHDVEVKGPSTDWTMRGEDDGDEPTP